MSDFIRISLQLLPLFPFIFPMRFMQVEVVLAHWGIKTAGTFNFKISGLPS
jgi:hypothetical protein